MKAQVQSGLEGIVVAESQICAIDGEKGTLCYRGVDIGDLAQHSTYEETVYLLWYGHLPTREELDGFTARLRAERSFDGNIRPILASLPGRPPPMEALRTAVSALSCCDPEVEDYGREANLNKALRLTTRLPIIATFYQRHLEGKEHVEPDPTLGHAANFLYMLHGERPTPLEERAADLAMVLMADHELNASTFAARVTASTLSDMYSAVTTAIGTLKGPLHGGANQRAMEMLLEIGSIDNARPYIASALAAKKRIMGFGHRVYRGKADPRSVYLRAMLRELGEQKGDQSLCDLAVAVADTVEEMKGLYPNVDYYTAPLLYLLDIPLDLFTPVFAISRIAGWTAHIMEQYEHNRLLRPVSSYVGPVDRDYVPIGERLDGYALS
ncbi:MAG: citrate/2-methylcitrate synthase [Anaerolineae bacterium]|jgi:citrate synthase